MADINVGVLEGTLSLKDAFTGVLKTASASLADFHKQFTSTMDAAAKKNEAFAKNMEATGSKFTKAGQALLGVSVAAGAAIAGVAKLTIDYESSFAGVKKTVNGTAAEIKLLEEGFKSMAQTIPVSVNELHAIGEAAGQLGIQKENIIGFTRVMADLGVATNLSSDEAASSLAKFANITQMSQKDFDRLGSVIVDLGNNFATTEADIVSMGMRIAGAGAQVGMSEHQIMAIAASLSSVGIEADAGGTAISKVMIDMASAVSEGGEQLALFAKGAGMSSEEFKKAFGDDAAGAINSFMTGLGRMPAEGGDVLAFLKEMGIEEVRMRDAILRASGAGDLMTNSLKTGAKAWEENIALKKEAEARYATLASQLTILWNKLKAVAVEIGLSLLPSLKEMVKYLDPVFEGLKKVAEWFAKLPTPVKLIIAGLVALTAVLAPLLLAFGSLAASISAIAGVGVSGAMLLAFGKIILIVAVVSAALWGLYKVFMAFGEATGLFKFLAAAAGIVKDKLAEMWKTFGAPLWDATWDAMNEVWEMFKAIFDMVVAFLTPAGDMNESLSLVGIAFDALTIGSKIFMVVLTDVMGLIQNIAWAAKQAANGITAMLMAWQEWTGQKVSDVKMPEAPKSAWAAASETKGPTIPGYEELLKISDDLDVKVTGKITKTKEQIAAAKKASEDWAKALEKAKEQLLGINTSNLQELNALATVFGEAIATGAVIADEAMISVGESFKSGIDSLRAQGKEIPRIWQEIFEAGELAKANKANTDAMSQMLNLDSITEATTQVNAYHDAQAMGAKLSTEAMEALDAVIAEAWQTQVNMGEAVPESWKKIREEAAKLRIGSKSLGEQLMALGEIPSAIKTDFNAMSESVKKATDNYKQMNATIRDAQWTVYLSTLKGTALAQAQLVKEHEDMKTAAYAMAEAQNWTNEKLQEYLNLIDQINGKKRQDLTVGSQIKTNLGGVFDNMGESISDAFKGGGGIGGALKAIGTDLADAIAKPLKAQLKDMGKQVGLAVAAGVAAAGAAGGAMGGSTGAMIGSMASGLGGAALGVTALGKAAATSMTAAVGLSAATMGIGLAAVGAYMAYKKFFTVSKEVKMMREEADKFQNSLVEMLNKGQAAEAGGERWKAVLIKVRDAYIRVGKTAEEAEDVVGRMWDTAHPEESKKAIAEIAEVMNDFKMSLEVTNAELEVMLTAATELGQKLPDSIIESLEAMAELGELTEENLGLLAQLSTAPGIDYKKFEEAAKRYNIDEAALGIEYVQFKSDEMAQQMINDFDLLTKGGASVGTVIGGMGDEISKLVTDSIKFGTVIPKNMEPWIELLKETGQLVDENGNAITDLSGLKFGDEMATEFEKITSAIQELVDVIKNDLVSAIGGIPSEIDAPKINNPNDGGSGGGGGASTSDDPGYASGTLGRHGQWFKNFGSGMSTKLHNDEAVVTKSQAPYFAADVLGMTAAGATGGEQGGGGTGAGSGSGKVTLPVTMVVGNKNVFLDIIMEQQDHRLALMGIRP